MRDTSRSRSSNVIELTVRELILPGLIFSNGGVSHVMIGLLLSRGMSPGIGSHLFFLNSKLKSFKTSTRAYSQSCNDSWYAALTLKYLTTLHKYVFRLSIPREQFF